MQTSAQELYLERQENKKLSELLKKCQSELLLVGSNGAKRDVDTFFDEKIARLSDQVRSDSLKITELESRDRLQREEIDQLRRTSVDEKDQGSSKKEYQLKIAQLKQFNKQLESQFNVQLQIVDFLKQELKKMQDALGEKSLKFDEATLTKLKLQQQIEENQEWQTNSFHAQVDQNLAKDGAGYPLKLNNGIDFSKHFLRLMQNAVDNSTSRQQILTNIDKLRQFVDESEVHFDAKEHLDALTALLQRVWNVSPNGRDAISAAQSLHITVSCHCLLAFSTYSNLD